MRVITGVAAGKPLDTLEGLDVRPTVSRVKEALFSSIQFEIPGSTVIDLFAGSGQLGLECLSRGARRAVFVDNSKRSLDIVRRNLEKCSLQSSAQLVNSDSISYLKTCSECFDIALLDPPYNSGLIESALPLLVQKMAQDAVIICESPFERELPEKVGDFKICKFKKYGKTKLTYYRRSLGK